MSSSVSSFLSPLLFLCSFFFSLSLFHLIYFSSENIAEQVLQLSSGERQLVDYIDFKFPKLWNSLASLQMVEILRGDFQLKVSNTYKAHTRKTKQENTIEITKSKTIE